MYLIETGSTNPYFNIAAEEYLFRNFQDDLLMLYINSPSVIIGKHQNAYEEINYRFINEHRVPVIRRISGGGAVYHDPGNLNFTYMITTDAGKQVSFRRFIDPIAGFLQEYGIVPEVGKKNEVRSRGLKFSGNAEHVFRNRVLHHGTILFSSELDKLSDSLQKGDAKFISRSVQSNRTSVGNLSDQMKSIKNTEALKKSLLEYMTTYFPNSVSKIIGDDEIVLIGKLIEEKYSTWNWNFAYGPSYEIQNSINISGRVLGVVLRVERGIIIDSLISEGNYVHPMSPLLVGLPHRLSEIDSILAEMEIEIEDSELYRLFG